MPGRDDKPSETPGNKRDDERPAEQRETPLPEPGKPAPRFG